MENDYTEIQEIGEIEDIQDAQDIESPEETDSDPKTLGIYHSDVIPAFAIGLGVFYAIGARKLPVRAILRIFG